MLFKDRSRAGPSLAKVIGVVPVSASEAFGEFEAEVDDIICTMTPQPFHSVGLWYDNFCQMDKEVRNLPG